MFHIVLFQSPINGQYQRIGGKIYSQDQLNMLEKGLQGSHFKPLNGSQNNLNNVPMAAGQGLDIPKPSDLDSNNLVPPKRNLLPVGNGVAGVQDSGVGGAKQLNNNVSGDIPQKMPKMNTLNPNVVDNSVNKVGDTGVQSNNANNGVFDMANAQKDVPKPDSGVLPSHVKFIDGDVEKNKQNEIVDQARDEMRNNLQPVEPVNNVRAPMQQEYENNNNNNNNFNNGVLNNAIHVDNNVQEDEPDEKPGSLKVVWDWSDFAVNFEQYIMPEQKIRRAPHATTGEPWPMPQYYIAKRDKVYTIDKANFRFDLAKGRCEIIEKAVKRYKPYILEDAVEDMYDNFQHAQSTMFEDPSLKYESPLYVDAPAVSKVYIKIRKTCAKFPTSKMDESCEYCMSRFNNAIKLSKRKLFPRHYFLKLIC